MTCTIATIVLAVLAAMSAECTGEVVEVMGSSGALSSLHSVPNDTAVTSTFIIHARAGEAVKIKFTWLSLLDDLLCAKESLEILDGEFYQQRNSLALLCGTGPESVPPRSIKSSGENITLVLKSNGPMEGRGFSLLYKSVTPTWPPGNCGIATMYAPNPWLAYITSDVTDCFATLISRWWLLTAAHCFSRPMDNTTQRSIGFLQARESRDIVRIVFHPKSQEGSLDYDIALVQMNQPVSFSEHLMPVCLPEAIQHLPLAGKMCFIDDDPTFDITYFKVFVRIVNQTSCASAFYGEALTSRMMCGLPTYGYYMDCMRTYLQAPPLMCLGEDGQFYLTGLASWNSRCETVPSLGVFSRLDKFLPFIEETIY
uniref:Transmembrane protease serine 9-like isoform X1 n=1 Tax=Petromyzon marinus TaxID=7757 RepID=A0AAJ7UF59_PETMA|nr:transmembrane protease serine 9-like isoform X1 [Petromyzon marinus]